MTGCPICGGKTAGNVRFCSRDCYGEHQARERGPLVYRVLVNCDRPTQGGCWKWTGRQHGRYGQLSYKGRRWLAHRASYAAFIGPIGPGLIVRHRCDNGACVNPSHLQTGTQADNVHDMIGRGVARLAGQQDEMADPRRV